MADTPKFGSPEWRTHMRRSLAQRKRAGEDIKDIEGLIDYIQEKGPSKDESTQKTKTKKSPIKATRANTVKAGSGIVQVRVRTGRRRIL